MDDFKNELWHEMLTTYCRLMHFKNGITLPNMIGAYYYYDNTIDLSSSQCVIRLLNDIIASQKDVKVLIQKGGNIQNYVLSLLEKSGTELPNLNNKIFVNMYDRCLHNNLSSVNELGEYLYSLYSKEIIANKFSVIDSVWHPLSNTEIVHIKNIINSL